MYAEFSKLTKKSTEMPYRSSKIKLSIIHNRMNEKKKDVVLDRTRYIFYHKNELSLLHQHNHTIAQKSL